MKRRIVITCAVAAAAVAVSLTDDVVAGEPRVLQLSIVGTEVEFNSAGLPVRMEGLLYYRSGPLKGRCAGIYKETLEPVIDPQRGLVGTTGRAVFRFVDRKPAGVRLAGEVTTCNHSSIVGVDKSTGAIKVKSAGTVVETTRTFAGMAGKLDSASTVVLAGEFNLETELTLTLKERKPQRLPGANGTADAKLADTVAGCPRKPDN